MITDDMRTSVSPELPSYHLKLFIIVSGILVFVLAFLFFLAGEASAKTLFVDDDAGEGGDGSPEAPFRDIQAAVNASLDGDTIQVIDGVYGGFAVVGKNNITITGTGRERSLIEFASHGFPRVYLGSGGITFNGFGSTSEHNGSQEGWYWVMIAGQNVTVSNSTLPGITLLPLSSHARLSDNRMIWGISPGSGSYLDDLRNWTTHDIDTSNTVNGKPVCYLSKVTGETVPAGAGQIILAGCSDMRIANLSFSGGRNPVTLVHTSNTTISGNTLSSSRWAGIALYSSEGNVVVNNTCTGNEYGIEVSSSLNNRIIDNTLLSNGHSGIYIHDAGGNYLRGNDCSGNQFYGIFMESSDYVRVFNGDCLSNGINGINVERSTSILLRDNNCSLNGWAGIGLQESGNCNVMENTLYANNVSGIELQHTSGTSISRNRCHANRDSGIRITFLSSSSSVVENNCTKNRHGILVESGESITVSDNDCSSNARHGIGLSHGTTSSDLARNHCFDNTVGISISASVDCIVDNNSCFSNDDHGVLSSHLSSGRNTFTGNRVFDNRVGMGFYFDERPTRYREDVISYNHIHDNHELGLNTSIVDKYTLVAERNWWGDDSGPYHPELNAEGRGDAVASNVSFQRWLQGDGSIHNPADPTEEDDNWLPFPLPEGYLPGILVGIVLLGVGGGLAVAFHVHEPFRFFLLRLFAPLYTRLNEDRIERDIKQQNIRGRIYQFIKDDPGVAFSEIRNEVGIGYGTTVYHLSVLLRERYIRSSTAGKQKLFWAKRDFPGNHDSVLTDIHRRILALLEKAGSLSRAQLRKKTGIPKTTLRNNIRQLKEMGRIVEEKQGRDFHCLLKK